ncbi:MAG TPA: Flp pilus assembly protein CpaB [Terriglobia bacterium]|nr:Flp pilus assembly protein CpaB [Terriglobia bacterium]
MDARRIVIALVLALALSGGATYFLYTRLRGSQARPQVTKIVAAAHPVSAGAAIKVDDVGLIDWPLNIPLAGSFSKVDDVVGRALIYPLGEKEPVLQRDLAEPGSGIGLSVKIPPGMRATSIRSNEIVGVAGFLFPGSHVDVIDTYNPPGSSSPITETVLQNVEVITAGQKIQPDPQGKPETVSVVTLLLSPKDSEKLLLATSQGQVQFVLRNGADTDQAKTGPVSLADLMGVVKAPAPVVTRTARARAPKAVLKAPPPPEFYTIEVIQGKERSEQKFPESGPK